MVLNHVAQWGRKVMLDDANAPPAGGTACGRSYHLEYAPLLGGSTAMREVRDVIETIADIDASVLLRGESGVGKDLVARAIHAASTRSNVPFVKVNCAAIPQGLLESELFGHEKGAFTGADRRRLGQFEYAHRGTIYLDEIAELPLLLQPKLLHVLQDRAITRVGGRTRFAIDVRIIAATNRDLELALKRGDFREDLYYRLNVIDITIPPLRDRKEEIPSLAARFLESFNQQYGKSKTLSPQMVSQLRDYHWPGNVRELENVIRRFVVLRSTEQALDVRPGMHSVSSTPSVAIENGLREIARNGARQAERRALEEVLKLTSWNRAQAARTLKVSYKTLLNKIAECGLQYPDARHSSRPVST